MKRLQFICIATTAVGEYKRAILLLSLPQTAIKQVHVITVYCYIVTWCPITELGAWDLGRRLQEGQEISM